MIDGEILLTKEGHVATLTISRPKKMNSITKAMGETMQLRANEINGDDEIRVVILTGEGEKSFSTGSDIKALDQYGSPFQLRNRIDYCDAVRSIRKPVISMIKGYALGGGFELVLATDIRVASDTAKFAVSEIKNGWIPGSGLIQVLSRNIGYHKAAELVFTAKMVDGKEAVKYGFINTVVDIDSIENYVKEMATNMAQFSPVAAQLAKQDLVASQNTPLSIGLDYEKDLAAFSMTTEDCKEGILAFKEKRAPEFKGK